MRAAPGWPRELPPPDDPDWKRRAIGWLLDQSPGEWRGIPELARQPLVLVVAVVNHVAATRAGVRATVAGLRSELAGAVTPDTAEAAVTALLAEEARLDRVVREVGLVAEAIRRAAAAPRGGGA